MAQDLFHLAARVIADVKWFACSINDIERELNDENGECEKECEHSIPDEFGNEAIVTLRLNINCKSKYPQGWTIALKMHGTRIDGIDWHATFTDPEGQKHNGWHRHHYNAKAKTADHTRYPVQGFDNLDGDAMGRYRFLIRALKEMRMTLDANDNGQDKLQFSQTIID
ncbi:MAG TPA: hypothetical protein VHV32_07550 [Candidatus Angelobacter sp.]|jgi:hypothetical protein|nr:hypothetical protein [Candidatus Angelobacter sp.]